MFHDLTESGLAGGRERVTQIRDTWNPLQEELLETAYGLARQAAELIQEGREEDQGVGYLNDGTMVVVEGGRHHLNKQLDVIVTRVLQTVAGRMIFAQPKGA